MRAVHVVGGGPAGVMAAFAAPVQSGSWTLCGNSLESVPLPLAVNDQASTSNEQANRIVWGHPGPRRCPTHLSTAYRIRTCW
jgi:hypothetical protein